MAVCDNHWPGLLWKLLAVSLLLSEYGSVVSAGKIVNGTCLGGKDKCKPGLILPLWLPDSNLSTGDKVARAVLYGAGLTFFFLGVSIIADRFMAAIEVITSQEKIVTVKRPSGEKITVSVRVWNETVSNLTLMALGSSAPEILLSVIEICGNNFDAGELGPGTIVGSAAFNMFMIISLCVYCVPSTEVRRVKHLRVFFITSAWSLFAYIWLYLIIAVISPTEVEVWEGVVTLVCFPLTVLTAYMADRRIFFEKFLPHKYRKSHHVVVSGEGGDVEMDKVGESKTENHIPDGIMPSLSAAECQEVREFENHRREYIQVLRDLRKKNPDVDMESLERMANFEIMNRGPKSRAFYRIQATRMLTGGGNILSKKRLEAIEQQQEETSKVEEDESHITKLFFEPGHYTVFENIGTMFVNVVREGGNLNNTVYVDFKTEDGTAEAGGDFDYTAGKTC